MSFMTVSLIAVALFVYWVNRLKQQERDRIHRGWLRLPVVDKYAEQHQPNRRGQNGCACCYCGSRSIRQFGLEARNDQRRIHACNHCNARLYRTYR